MSGARVTSIAGLTEFVAELAGFGKEAREALSANDMEIQRAVAWLDDMVLFWKKEINVRREAALGAKNNLSRKKMIKIGDRRPDCTEEEKELRRTQRRLAEAETKSANSKRWVPALRRAVDEYLGQSRHLANTLEADLPRVRAQLTQRIAALEAYIGMAPPVLAGAPPSSVSSDTAAEPPHSEETEPAGPTPTGEAARAEDEASDGKQRQE